MNDTTDAPGRQHESDSTPAEIAVAKTADSTPLDVARCEPIADAMARVERVVGEHFPAAVEPVKAALAVAAVGCLSDNRQPTTLIFVAPASAGKSMCLNFMMPSGDADPLSRHFYRSDKFTSASMVTHRADLEEEKLAKADLLPRLKNKTLLTKELAPIFTGKREELTERFAVLTAVLDGDGYTSDSGAHGKRGYTEPINFQWLGATTPLSPEVLGVMAALGPRMLFYDADRSRKDTAALIDLARRSIPAKAKAECRAAVADLILRLHQCHPIGSLDSARIDFDDRNLRFLVLWAQVLVALRATVRASKRDDDFEDEDIPTPDNVEHPERVLGILKNIAAGSAIAHGRSAVGPFDLEQVAHIALSSGVVSRSRVFRGLLVLRGTGTTSEIMERSGLSRPTVIQYMKELVAVGLARVTSQPRKPLCIALSADFVDLCDAPLRKVKRGEGEGEC